MGTRDNTNGTPIIHRVRRRNDQLHITFTSGNRMVLPVEVNNPYRSRRTGGVTDGAFDVKR